MSEGVRKTLSHAAIYGLGNVLANATGIIMLPIYTRFLTPTDYGVLEFLQMLMDITSIIFGARALTGVFRIYFDKDDEDHRKTVICTSLLTDVVLHSLGAITLIALASPLAELIMGDAKYASYITVFAFSLITMALFQVPFIYLRALNRPWPFILISLLKLLCQIGFNIYFVVLHRMGALGVILGTVITGVLVGGALTAWTFRRTGWRISRATGVRLLRFGIPFALASVGSFYTIYGDRFFIRHFWGLAEVGLYALAYRFGFALSYLVFGTFNQAWAAQAYTAYREPNGAETFRRVFLLIMLALVFTGTALSVLARDILYVMADPTFHAAAAQVPPLLLAFIARSAGDFCGFGIRYTEKTKYFLHASIVSVIVMSIGFVTLIPRWGGAGAAYATMVGMAIEAWWIARISERLVPLNLPWGKVFVAIALGIGTYLLTESLATDDLLLSIGTELLILLAFAAIVIYSPIVGASERQAALRLLGDITRRVKAFRLA